ncbi:MAG: energy-coupling factor ABC transporter permease [Patescibacteria group bacterium]|jgi:cobalt/nickel transport system permease protein
MHIPDGFLGPNTSFSLIAVSLTAISFAVKKVKSKFFVRKEIPALVTSEGVQLSSGGNTKVLSRFGKEKLLRMATVASFVFAAQMLNFPVAEGTSGHLLGGVLSAILLGPLEGLIVISAVLVVQSLFFADGGLVALGANVFNMGIIGTIAGFYGYKAIIKILKFKLPSVFLAAWLSVVLASIGTSLELAISNTIPLSAVFPAMVSTHALIGIGEGIITFAVVWYLRKEDEQEI